MEYLLSGEQLLFCGIGLMAIAAGAAVLCLAAFAISGRRLRKTLEEEYGKPQR